MLDAARLRLRPELRRLVTVLDGFVLGRVLGVKVALPLDLLHDDFSRSLLSVQPSHVSFILLVLKHPADALEDDVNVVGLGAAVQERAQSVLLLAAEPA